MINISSPFEQFLKEKQYIAGVTTKTLRTYREAFTAFLRYRGEVSTAGVKAFVIEATQAGVKPGAVNSFARGINSFLSWLAENGHTPQRFKVPLVKQPKRTLTTYSTEDARKILSHKPRHRTEHRLLTILALIVDCGLRINECLTLARDAVDFDNLVITVEGKGRKQRVVPFSIECRKVLFRWSQSHAHDLLFPNRDGCMLRYDNLRRDFLQLLESVGVQKSDGAFHAFRRFAARQYLRNGGNVRYLQVLLGHSDIQTTTVYLDSDTEALSLAHRKLSPLESLKKNIQSCRHERIRVSELVARTSRLNPRVSRVCALVCDDCGRVLLTDSIQPINLILKTLETLEERISAIERVSEADRKAHYRIAA